MINKQMMRDFISLSTGKTIKRLAGLWGGGSALPGLIVEKIDPKFIKRSLDQLPLGVVVITGTNGKTTTTKIVTELLQSTGLKVLTNPTGSNFSRGIVAALINQMSLGGKLEADIAVLELDEAWAVRFVKMVQPRYSLLLNIMRDQLDRFGEIDKISEMLGAVADSTSQLLVLNRDDQRVNRLGGRSTAKKLFFGASSQLLERPTANDDFETATATSPGKASVLLTASSGNQASFLIDNQTHTVDLALSGSYNQLNAAAAITLVQEIVPQADIKQLLKHLSRVQPAFGRGETIVVDKQPVELVLVKNPSGFSLAIEAFSQTKLPTMIAVNDNYADGRDMSWLWDVDFRELGSVTATTGARVYDITLRLQYDEITPEIIEPDIAEGVERFLASHPGQPKRIFCSYTAMLAIRKNLLKRAGSP